MATEVKGNLVDVVVHDPTGKLLQLEGNASGYLKVDVAAVDVTVPISQAADALTHKVDLVGVWGEVPGTPPWPMADCSEQVVNLNATTGTNTLNGTTVGSGEKWKITNVAATNVNHSPSVTQLQAVKGGVAILIHQVKTPGAGVPVQYAAEIMLFPGDNIRAVFYDCTAGDDLYLEFIGYKIQT